MFSSHLQPLLIKTHFCKHVATRNSSPASLPLVRARKSAPAALPASSRESGARKVQVRARGRPTRHSSFRELLQICHEPSSATRFACNFSWHDEPPGSLRSIRPEPPARAGVFRASRMFSGMRWSFRLAPPPTCAAAGAA